MRNTIYHLVDLQVGRGTGWPWFTLTEDVKSQVQDSVYVDMTVRWHDSGMPFNHDQLVREHVGNLIWKQRELETLSSGTAGAPSEQSPTTTS